MSARNQVVDITHRKPGVVPAVDKATPKHQLVERTARLYDANNNLIKVRQILITKMFGGCSAYHKYIHEHFGLLKSLPKFFGTAQHTDLVYRLNGMEPCDLYIPHVLAQIYEGVMQREKHHLHWRKMVRGGFKTQPPVDRQFRPIPGTCHCSEQ